MQQEKKDACDDLNQWHYVLSSTHRHNSFDLFCDSIIPSKTAMLSNSWRNFRLLPPLFSWLPFRTWLFQSVGNPESSSDHFLPTSKRPRSPLRSQASSISEQAHRKDGEPRPLLCPLKAFPFLKHLTQKALLRGGVDSGGCWQREAGNRYLQRGELSSYPSGFRFLWVLSSCVRNVRA